MDHLLMLLLLLWSSGLQAEGKHQSTGSQCETTAKADIILLVDESGSISPEDYQKIMPFLIQIVTAFDIGPDKDQIGLVQYSHFPRIEWELNTHQTKQSLLEAINKLEQKPGGTNTGLALNYILDNNFQQDVGMRADSHKMAILITDGRSQDSVTLPSQHLRDTGIEIYTIGVGNARTSELRDIASHPVENHVYMLSDYSALLAIIKNFTVNLCNSTTSSLGSVRLVNGPNLCSGRVEVMSDQLNQSWSSVCDADFDQQDAEVVCRELGCGAPSFLQGALYGQAEAPMWTKEFQCGGNESALLDCGRSDSARSTCSPGKAVGLNCSEPVRLVGGASRCAGTLELKRKKWRPVQFFDWTMKEAAAACGDLVCGSGLSTRRRDEFSDILVWRINPKCISSGYTLRECATSSSSSSIVELICSNLLVQPIISVSSTMDGVSKASLTISCSVQPQYPGGSFQLTFTSSNTAHKYTKPAVNHSADFLFPAADPAHQGSYSCVYSVYVFDRNFSSESHQLSFPVTGSQYQRTAKADIMLLVDESGSISSGYYRKMKPFLSQIVNNFDIGPDKVQIGLVQYSHKPKTKWQLNTHQTKKSLLEEINRLEQRGGCPYTGRALNHILHNNFKLNVGMRADSHKIVILITDGDSYDNVTLPSRHLRDSGIEIYTIGGADKAQLSTIASHPVENHVYMLSDYSALRDIVNKFIINLSKSTTSSLDLMVQPMISVSLCSTMDGVSEAQQQEFQVCWGSKFIIRCSVQPQYPGGSFQLTFTSSKTTHTYTRPAVSHSADFLFLAAFPAHQGNYSCVYSVHDFARNFSSESRRLSLTVTDPSVFIITLVVLPVTLLFFIIVICFIPKARRRQKSNPQQNIKLDFYNLGVSRAEGEPAEEKRAQRAE